MQIAQSECKRRKEDAIRLQDPLRLAVEIKRMVPYATAIFPELDVNLQKLVRSVSAHASEIG